MRTGDWIAVLVAACLFCAGAAWYVPWVEDRQREQDHRAYFEGACIYLTGTVKDDVCVTDGKVVLTKEEFAALLP